MQTALMYFWFGPQFEEMIENDQSIKLGTILFIICLIVAIQDIAIDGMVCDILNEEDYKGGSLMQTLG